MSAPEDAEELSLVRRAICESRRFTSGYCEWKESSARRIREHPPLVGLTPEAIKSLLVEHIVDRGGEIVQVREEREEYRDKFAFYYKSLVPVEGSSQLLFVEFVLRDDDPDDPAVLLVNAHF